MRVEERAIEHSPNALVPQGIKIRFCSYLGEDAVSKGHHDIVVLSMLSSASIEDAFQSLDNGEREPALCQHLFKLAIVRGHINDSETTKQGVIDIDG